MNAVDTTTHVVISKIELEELKDNALKLLALEQSGVDNWTWYGDAMDQYRTWKEEANDPAIQDPDGEAEST